MNSLATPSCKLAARLRRAIQEKVGNGMVEIPILRVDEILVVSMREDLTDTEADELLTLVGENVAQFSARGLLVDMSAVSTVDSYMGRAVISIAQTAGLLGAVTVLTGIRPAVAITIVELGMDFTALGTALTLQAGLDDLRMRLGSDR